MVSLIMENITVVLRGDILEGSSKKALRVEPANNRGTIIFLVHNTGLPIVNGNLRNRFIKKS